MTVERQDRSIRHEGNGIATIFPYPFVIPSAEYAEVSLQNSEGVVTPLTSSQYSISGVGDQSGGNVTYPLSGAPLASDNFLIISRTVPYTQSLDLVNQGGFYPETLEGQLDLTVMQIQQLVDPISRAVITPPGDSGITLPSAQERAGKFFAFDANGDFVGASGTGADGDLRADLGQNGGAALVNFQPVGVGASSRSVQDKLLDVVSVLDFIPVNEHAAIRAGTSTYDCSAAFQAAVDAAMTVFVPNGRYIIDATVREKTNGGARNLIGQNRLASKIVAGSTLAASGDPIFWFGNSNGHGNYRLRFQHLSLDGGDTAGKGAAGAIGLRAHECGTSFIGDLYITGCSTAIDAIGCIGYTLGGERSEIYASQKGLWHTAPTGGATPGSTGGDSLTTTESALTLHDNINHIANWWMSGVAKPIRLKGGLTQVDHVVLQNCGSGASDDLIHLDNANESYDYGGGPSITNIWCEGGSYRSIIRVEHTRDARIRRCFLSGAAANGEQGILVINSSGARVDDVSARGTWSRTPTEGRGGNYWLHVDSDSRNGYFGPFYYTSNSCSFSVDRSSATHNHIIVNNHTNQNLMNGLIVGPIKISGTAVTKDPDGPSANITISNFQSIEADERFEVAGTKVVGAQGAAVPDATDGTDVITRLNTLLARLRTHGLIAS